MPRNGLDCSSEQSPAAGRTAGCIAGDDARQSLPGASVQHPLIRPRENIYSAPKVRSKNRTGPEGSALVGSRPSTLGGWATAGAGPSKPRVQALATPVNSRNQDNEASSGIEDANGSCVSAIMSVFRSVALGILRTRRQQASSLGLARAWAMHCLGSIAGAAWADSTRKSRLVLAYYYETAQCQIKESTV